MPIILEGPDGSGKSTVADTLVGAGLELQPRHITSDGELSEGTHDLSHWVMEQLAAWQNNPHQATLWLYDRFPLFGEVIYGPTLRGIVQDRDVMGMLTRAFWQMHVAIIVCLPPLETTLDNVFGDDEDSQHPDLTVDRQRRAWWSYWHLAHWGPKIYRYNYLDDPDAAHLLGALGVGGNDVDFVVGMN